MLDLRKFQKSVDKNADAVLNNANNFLIFVIVAILSTLLFFKQTMDNYAATLILLVLWRYFWRRSTLKGKVFLSVASVVGFVHEIIGVYFGWFTYIGGFIYGVPLWILPGYGAIFWASYNFWSVFEKSYAERQWFSNMDKVAAATFIALLAIDYIFLDLSQAFVFTLLKIGFSFLLFRSARGMRLAFFVGLFTVFDEVAGEIIGVWVHPTFSLLSLMAGYIFLLWVCLTITEMIKGTKKWRLMELASAVFLFIMMVFNLAA
ncbi:MAG: hypothetical protein KAT91_03785 [Candidatus Aenigmarchaeota archaeon]|nr:hypothetical protein [Candidatus Aenigmarchaeota archaeon]